MVRFVRHGCGKGLSPNGFAWAFKSYSNNRKWWSKKYNVLPRALAWSNVTKFEKNDCNRLYGPDSNPNLDLYTTPVEKQTGWFIASNCVDLQHNYVLAVSVLSANYHEGLNETRVGNNDMLLLKGGDGFLDSEGGAKNHEFNKDKKPTLADVLDEIRALRKEVALVMFDDARIAKLERLLNDNFMFRNDSPNGNHNAVNQGISGSDNHPMSTCSRPDIDNAEVAGHVIEIHKADGKNDSPNGNQNGVNKGLSCSANDPMSTCSGLDILDGEVVGALIGIHKVDGKNDSPNVNHNAVNKGLSCSDNDPMLDVLIQVACDGKGIDKADGNNDYTYSQCEPSTLDVLVQGFDSQKNQSGIDVLQHDTHVDCFVAKLNDHPTANISVKPIPVDEFADDFLDVLKDEKSIPNYSLDDMKLQDEEDKLISSPAPVNHQHVDELIDMHEDKTTVLQENVKDQSNKSQYVNVVTNDYKPCLASVFANVKAKRNKCGIERNYVLRSVKERKKRLAMALDSPFGQQATTTPAPPKKISRSVNGDFIAPPEFLEDVSGGSMIDYYFNGVRYPVAWRDVEKVFLVYEELEYGVLLPNDVNYSNLVRYVKKKFKVGDANQISLSYNIGSISLNIIDDDDVRFFVNEVSGEERENEGTVTYIEMDDKGCFKMCFIGFGVAIKSFLCYMRSLIIIDAAHFKGTYLGTNLVAVGMDGNNQIIPIATSVSQGETGESWTWFLRRLKECIGNFGKIASEVPTVLEFLMQGARKCRRAQKEVGASSSEFSHLNHSSLSSTRLSVKPDISKPDISKASSVEENFNSDHHVKRNGPTPHHDFSLMDILPGKSTSVNYGMQSDKFKELYWKTCKAYTPKDFEKLMSDIHDNMVRKKLKSAQQEESSQGNNY
ncbi:phospholipase-like protein [Tanacetum coccineum]